jgi:hypothetical protein
MGVVIFPRARDHLSAFRILMSAFRILMRTSALLAILALAAAWPAASARADGDPASDVLVVQSLFLPQDANVSATKAAQIEQLLREGQHAGYQIRVALVASAADLGSVTELWRKPQTYAEFLAQELGLVYHGPLLIVMPNGLGFHAPQRPLGAASKLPASIRGLAPGSELGSAALTAIRQLAAASGHTLPVPTVRAPHTSTARTIEDTVFIAGVVICIVAFILSALDRPLRIRRKPSASAE